MAGAEFSFPEQHTLKEERLRLDLPWQGHQRSWGWSPLAEDSLSRARAELHPQLCCAPHSAPPDLARFALLSCILGPSLLTDSHRKSLLDFWSCDILRTVVSHFLVTFLDS